MHSSQRFADGQSRNSAYGSRVVVELVARHAVVGLAGIFMLSGVGRDATAQAPDRYGAATGSASAQSPIWLQVPATNAPGVVQPPSLKPGASPYPRTNFPALGGVIAQPHYLAPATATPADEVIVSDAAVASKLNPPIPAKSLASPREFEPAPIHAAPKQTSRFWEFVLGPSPQLPARTTATSSAAPAAKAPSGNPGGSLLSQLLGMSSPPLLHAKSAEADVSELTNPFLLTSAEEVAPAAQEQRRPTERDVEEAKTPATSMSITRPGLLQQMGVPIESAPEPTPNMAGVPRVPSVSSQSFEGVAAALWRPLSSMTNDAPSIALPDGPNVRSTAANDRSRLPESERVPSLLRPFYVTNSPPTASRRTVVNESSDVPTDVAHAFIRSSLGRQLSMMSDEDLRTAAVASIDAEVKRNEQPWDGTVTVQWPLMANPFTLTDAAGLPSYASENVSQVAFLQESLPSPPGGTSAPDNLDLPGSQDAAEDDQVSIGDGEKKDEKDTLVGAKTLGTAPEDNTLEFLRTSTVLLEPGKSQFDIGLEYTLTENNFPILLTDGMGTVVGVDDVEIKGRELAVPMELRYGLLRRVQAFVQVPVGWSNVQAAINNFDEFANDGGVGDVGFGLTMQLRDADKDRPYLIGTLAGLAPTGGDPFLTSASISPNSPSLGSGFWAISGNLLWVQTRYDPVVVFYGLGARYQFAREYIGIEFAPGTEYNYTLGTGFSVNERVTLSAQFFGSYIEELKANGERVEGTIQEPMNLRLAATLAKPCNRIVEPFVTFGLTDDSISSNFGITWTY
jgi:hypothetical protein